MSEAEYISFDSVDAVDAQITGSSATQSEIDEQFEEIVHTQGLINEPSLQLGDPLSLQSNDQDRTPFITQGFVAGIETQIRDYYFSGNQDRIRNHQASVDLPPELSEDFRKLVERIVGGPDVLADPYNELYIRIGRRAVRPFEIRDHLAIPSNHYLESGSLIELRKVISDVESQLAHSEHPRHHPYAGSYGTFLPIAWIGRILNEEGNLYLKNVGLRPGMTTTKDSLWNR